MKDEKKEKLGMIKIFFLEQMKEQNFHEMILGAVFRGGNQEIQSLIWGSFVKL